MSLMSLIQRLFSLIRLSTMLEPVLTVNDWKVHVKKQKQKWFCGLNDRASSSKRTRHLNVRYFFIHDRIEAKEVRVEYCPTADMLGDFFSKPLQGALFTKFRNIIMNVPSSINLFQDDHSPLSSKDHRSVLEPNDWKVHVKKQKQN